MSQLSVQQAFSLFMVTKKLGGPASYHTVYKSIQDKITKTYPELNEPIKVDSPILQEKKELKLNLEDKTVLVYSLAELYSGNLKTVDRDMIDDLCTAIGEKFAKSVKGKVTTEPIKLLSAAEVDDDIELENE